MANLKDTIREEVNRFLIREYMAAWRDDAITSLARQIANDFAPLNMESMVNRDKVFKARYSLYLGDNEIPILVTYRINGNGWHGTYSKNNIVLNLYGKITANGVLSGLYHEITHAIDANNKMRLGKRIGYKYGGNYIKLNVRSASCDAINDILYKLWTYSERNAYQSHALFGIKYCESFLKEIKEKIDYLNTHENKNEDIIYTELRNRLAAKWDRGEASYIGNKRVLNSSWRSFKRFFIKKSYALFEVFRKKLINNAYKAQEEGLVVQLTPNENSEVFTKFKKENDSVQREIERRRTEKEQLRQIRLKKAAKYLKELYMREHEVIGNTFITILENMCKDKYGEKQCCQKEQYNEGFLRNCALVYFHDCCFYGKEGDLDILTSKHGFNTNYYLVFDVDENEQYAISDGKDYCVNIFSRNLNNILIDIIMKSIVREEVDSLYELTFDKKIMYNGIINRKNEIIGAIGKSLDRLYAFVVKQEYTLSIRLKDRTVDLSAPSKDELAAKLRSEFPKWNDAVVNNWVSKAKMN